MPPDNNINLISSPVDNVDADQTMNNADDNYAERPLKRSKVDAKDSFVE